MANQPLAFGMLLSGGTLLVAALTGSSVKEVVTGEAGPFRGFDISGLGSGTPAQAAEPGQPGQTGTPATGADGKLIGKPIDRPGVPTGAGILAFAHKVAGVYGKPVQLGTGTAHDQMTTSGNVSAHWSGNALDLPAVGAANFALGRAALVAAGMTRSAAAKATGGIYNVGSYQIIFQTNEGGNHYNHVHIGLRR